MSTRTVPELKVGWTMLTFRPYVHGLICVPSLMILTSSPNDCPPKKCLSLPACVKSTIFSALVEVWLCSTLIAMVPGWITLVWGYSLIQDTGMGCTWDVLGMPSAGHAHGNSSWPRQKCETCQKTNPYLFYDLQSYIRFQRLSFGLVPTMVSWF